MLTSEEGSVTALHYGHFARPDEPIGVAQERATQLLLSRLSPPPARVLDVGCGVGRTTARLARLGYATVGITPDPAQAAIALEEVAASGAEVRTVALQDFAADEPFDVVLFHESSQYLDAALLWSAVGRVTAPGGSVLVLDEFTAVAEERPGELPRLDRFLAEAAAHGFALGEEVDVSRLAAPTVDWFLARLPARRAALASSLGFEPERIDELVASGERYRERYRTGEYVYRLLRFSA